jgi:hypothetical protein
MANEQMDLAAAGQRRDELMVRMTAMDPDAIDEMQEFLGSLPTEVLKRLQDDVSR